MTFLIALLKYLKHLTAHLLIMSNMAIMGFIVGQFCDKTLIII